MAAEQDGTGLVLLVSPAAEPYRASVSPGER